jgi:hypothetical protein
MRQHNVPVVASLYASSRAATVYVCVVYASGQFKPVQLFGALFAVLVGVRWRPSQQVALAVKHQH